MLIMLTSTYIKKAMHSSSISRARTLKAAQGSTE